MLVIKENNLLDSIRLKKIWINFETTAEYELDNAKTTKLILLCQYKRF